METLSQVLTISLLAGTIRVSTPIVLAALGETLSERAGVLNLGVEGIMLVGAFVGFWTAFTTDSTTMGIALALLTGAIMGLIMAFMSVTLNANQVIVGIALWILGSGLTLFFNRLAFGHLPLVPRIDTLEPIAIPGLSQLPVLGPLLFNQNIFVYFALLLTVVLGIVLYHTHVGLRIQAVGERPRAADSAGISVVLIRYSAVVIAGALAGLGGAYITLGELGLFVTNVTGGRGFIAVALVVFGRWDPYRVLAGGLLFAFIDALQIRLQSAGAGVPEQFMVMMPYLLTILVLLVVGRRAEGPESLAVPFQRGER